MEMFVCCILLLSGALFENSLGYPNGKIMDACDSMLPKHGNSAPQPTQAPYSIALSVSSYNAGDNVKVTLQANSGYTFKGFLLQTRTLRDDKVAGTFKIIDANSQGLPCSGTKDSSVSHIADGAKTLVNAIWVAPPGLGPVKFRTTFLQSYSTFWTQVESQVLLEYQVSNATCSTQKFCFSNPTGCNPASDAGCYFMSSLPAVGGGFVFEMSGPSDGYVAIGFSDDKKMGNDDIYICGNSDTTGQVVIQHAFSTGYTTPTPKSLGNMGSTMVSYTKGILTCSFFTNNTISLQARDASNQYYVFLAYGPMKNGQIMKHSRDPFITDQAVSMESVITTPASTESSFTILKVHGALMLIAWMTTGSIGMIIARYLKNTVKKSIMGKDIWFQAHRFLMVLTVAATITGFVLAFVYVKGWSGDAGAHPILGCIVMILSFFQPILALFRPAPKSERRFIFNWGHSLNALVIKVLAVAAIFLGLQQPSISVIEWMVKVMGGFVAWEALTYIILEVNAQLEKRGIQKVPDGKTKNEVIVLLVYICGNLAFLIALLVGIGQL
ncbi:putative ferric-chelate reductase 1 [Rhinatrema bivittatum]|uniref:putative ferric-chelate reductase 1 n=1 Tax=Rhinatrema bivittatum TaxID=194408 RepID=UPI001128C194|nr:putative ferric-chelate reductase 1 [Rhinatrema bivittatum]XP_029474105.1 putative ferric-chelate reductase 1 [Rhinatrema bivittatum]XP_029474106.1 putative ferric-chelate reductase 1 [Rhinatrema bivittatum]XP_029474107.1 putative ferric-chelate reductase 1 [Rhinatrema bivittatum]